MIGFFYEAVDRTEDAIYQLISHITNPEGQDNPLFAGQYFRTENSKDTMTDSITEQALNLDKHFNDRNSFSALHYILTFDDSLLNYIDPELVLYIIGNTLFLFYPNSPYHLTIHEAHTTQAPNFHVHIFLMPINIKDKYFGTIDHLLRMNRSPITEN